MAKFKLHDGTEIEAFTKDELDAEVGGLKAKVTELLALHDKDKTKLTEIEKQRVKDEQERQQKEGEYKALWEKTATELEAERAANQSAMAKIQRRDIESATMLLGMRLTKDVKRAGILAEKAQQFARHSDDGVTFEIGGLPATGDKVVEYLKAEYPFLADGSGANGGGAPGGSLDGKAEKANMGGSKTERQAAISARFNLPPA